MIAWLEQAKAGVVHGDTIPELESRDKGQILPSAMLASWQQLAWKSG